MPVASVATACAQFADAAQKHNTQTQFVLVYYSSGGAATWICGAYANISLHNAAAYAEALDGVQYVFGDSQRR